MRQAAHHVRLPGWAWSLILAVTAVVRASSYLTRPPDEDAGGLDLIESQLPYSGWAGVLITGAVLIVAGIALWLTGSNWSPWLAFAGHVILLGATCIFVTSVTISAATTDMGWSGLAPLLVVAVLHTERILCIGTNIGRR
jgi:hypothetical protein